MTNTQIGRVTLVGAGPGDPDLLTVKAVKAIARADVLVFDRLVSAEVLALAPAHIRRVDVGKQSGHHSVPQDEINEILIELAREGRDVVRLKGGDPLIFGRGGEELEALRDAGIPCACIPGITAAQGAASAAQIPLTHRGLATSLRYVTGHRAANAPLDLDWESLASGDTTLVVYMGASTIGEIAGNLMAQGLAASTPVLAIAAATTRKEQRVLATLGGIAGAVRLAATGDPVLFIIGAVAALATDLPVRVPLRLVRECHALASA